MWLSAEDARSDVILTVAAVLLGRYAVGLLGSLPFYPYDPLVVGLALSLVWLVLLALATPYGLARYRGDVPGAFGLGARDRGSLSVGLVVAAPLLVGYLLPLVLTGDLISVALGLLGTITRDGPAISSSWFTLERLYLVVAVPVLAVGSWLFASLVVVRSRDAFRSPDADLTELLRTFGMGGVAASLVLGLLVSVRGGGFAYALLVTLVVGAVVLLTDQYVPARVTTTRATLLAPAIAVLVVAVLNAGGLFRGDLLGGLYNGVCAGTLVLCVAALLEVRQGIAAGVLVVATVLYPTVSTVALHPTGLPLLLP